MPLVDFGEVGPNLVERRGCFVQPPQPRSARPCPAPRAGRPQPPSRRPNEHLTDDAALFGGDDVLHLHRFQDQQRLPGSHRLADIRAKGDDHRLHRSTNLEGTGHPPLLAASPRNQPIQKGDCPLFKRVNGLGGFRLGWRMERTEKNVRLGMTLPVAGADKAVEMARAAIDRGYEEVWMAEVNGGDSYALAGAVAQGLPGTRIGTAVVPAQTRTPMVHAMAAMTLSQMTNGNFILGLGLSSPNIVQDWAGQPFDRPLTRMREHIEVLRQMMSGQKTNYEGKTLSVKGFRLGGAHRRRGSDLSRGAQQGDAAPSRRALRRRLSQYGARVGFAAGAWRGAGRRRGGGARPRHHRGHRPASRGDGRGSRHGAQA